MPAESSPKCSRERLHAAIEEHWPDLLTGIQIYVRKFGLSRDPAADDSLARDILQDAILAALQSADKFDSTRPVRPWLLGIALNCLRHACRDRALEQKHVIPVAETAPVLA